MKPIEGRVLGITRIKELVDAEAPVAACLPTTPHRLVKGPFLQRYIGDRWATVACPSWGDLNRVCLYADQGQPLPLRQYLARQMQPQQESNDSEQR